MAKNFSKQQGLTYCRPERKQQQPLEKTSPIHCSICQRRRRGANHDQGARHRTLAAQLESAKSSS